MKPAKSGLFYLKNLNAQVISPLVQNSTGKSNEQNGTTLIYSVCELTSINNFISSNNSILNTGFLNTYKIENVGDLLKSMYYVLKIPKFNIIKNSSESNIINKYYNINVLEILYSDIDSFICANIFTCKCC